MLALPVLTGQAGFFPSLLVYLLCWLFMATTGLLMLEVCLWMEPGANLITMSERTLGRMGKYAAWALYIFLFYSLTLAYILGCGDIIAQFLPGSISQVGGILIFVVLVSPFLYLGAKEVSSLNAWLMIFLIALYFAFVGLGISYIKPELLTYKNWKLLPLSLPIAFTAFAYQGIIPTLVSFMDRDVKQLRLTILIGTFIPLIVYVVWQVLILGIVPVEGPYGLYQTLIEGQTAVYPLKYYLQSQAVYWIGQLFAFLALATSFLGVTLGLQHFLADGLKIEEDNKGKTLLLALIILPSLTIALAYPKLFLIALDLAGGIGCALLLGLMPVLMAYKGRQRFKTNEYQLVGGGNWTLAMLTLFIIFELICQAFILKI